MIAPKQLTKKDVLRVLERVKDPEIDTVSILDLGMVESVSIQNESVRIKILPTFVGCPALEIIRNNIVKTVNDLEGVKETAVEFINKPPWTSDRITSKGYQGLKEFGIAPLQNN
jgi:ring-1,2-phenylacetyl-CoA epoxidase subunit PaaD